jgi:chromosome segregation ATPase
MSKVKGAVKDWLWISSTAFGLGFCIGLFFNRDFKQAIVVASATVPATGAAVLITRQRENRKVRQNLISLHAEVRELESQKNDFLSSITIAKTRIERLHVDIEGLKTESAHLETDLVTLKAVYQAEFEKLSELERRQQEYNNQIAVFTADLQALEVRSQTAQQSLQVTLAEKQQQEAELAKLRTQRLVQQQRKSELDASVAQKQVRQQKLLETVEHLQTEKQQLEAQIAAQVSQREALQEKISQLLAQLENLSSSGFDLETV